MQNSYQKILIIGQGVRGGTDYVLKLLAEWLIENDVEAFYSDNLNNIKEIEYCLAIIPTSRMHDMHKLTSNKSNLIIHKFLVWSLGSLALHGAYYNISKEKYYPKALTGLIRRLVSITAKNLTESRSIIFSDEVGLFSDLKIMDNSPVDYFNLVYPVPIKLNDKNKKILVNSKIQSIAWVGRLDDDFKILPLLYLIEDIDALVQYNLLPKNLKLIIIGEGNSYEKLLQAMAKCHYLTFETHKWLSQDALEYLLIEKVDILCAMGSSALIGSKLGVPTVIVNPFTHEHERRLCNYRWIHETNGHTLGEFPDILIKPKQTNIAFSEIIRCLDLNNQGKLSKEFSTKFDCNLVFRRLIERKSPVEITKKTRYFLLAIRLLYNLKQTIKFFIGLNRK